MRFQSLLIALSALIIISGATPFHRSIFKRTNDHANTETILNGNPYLLVRRVQSKIKPTKARTSKIYALQFVLKPYTTKFYAEQTNKDPFTNLILKLTQALEITSETPKGPLEVKDQLLGRKTFLNTAIQKLQDPPESLFFRNY